jgi:hypothetical protein
MTLQSEIASLLYRNKYVQDQTLHLNRYELADAILALVRERLLSDEALYHAVLAHAKITSPGGLVDVNAVKAGITAALDAITGTGAQE